MTYKETNIWINTGARNENIISRKAWGGVRCLGVAEPVQVAHMGW
jgi:hypothetical protein